jgi:hypothetical protein
MQIAGYVTGNTALEYRRESKVGNGISVGETKRTLSAWEEKSEQLDTETPKTPKQMEIRPFVQ